MKSESVSNSPQSLSISSVERETGISKEVLRKWETRYGYPSPVRDEQGERIYAPEHVARLKLIKRLMDGGARPSKVVPVASGDLAALAEKFHVRMAGPAALDEESELLGFLRAHDLVGLRRHLQRLLLSRGLSRFVLDTVAPLSYAVGEAWSRGELEIHEEHLYTELVQGMLRGALETLSDGHGFPRILLTTPPEEAHALGVLMVSALLALDGAYCISLGAQTPLGDIVSAVLGHEADIVILSFSIAYPQRRIAPILTELRAHLPGEVTVWAGGAGTARLGRPPAGVVLTPTLEAAQCALQAWRESRVR